LTLFLTEDSRPVTDFEIMKKPKTKIRSTFPQVYRLTDRDSGGPYFVVSARSKKFGMNHQKRFPTEDEAVAYHEQIKAQILNHGMSVVTAGESDVVKKYLVLSDRLKPFLKTPEEAVDWFIGHLGREAIRNTIPTIEVLADKWKEFKYSDTTLSKPMLTEIKMYVKFIKWKWGTQKPDELKRNDIDLVLRGLQISNNTRKKYLLFIRMFFGWCLDEGKLLKNPTDGISFKGEVFRKEFHQSQEIKTFLQQVIVLDERLVGYYSLLIFAGLRPAEGAKVRWEDINFETNQLYVRKSKTDHRYINLEPVTMEWLKWFKEHSAEGSSFIPPKNLYNLERWIREETFGDKWLSHGFRHGFGTYHKSKYQNIHLTSDLMGNSVQMIKKHYAQTVPSGELTAYWGLTPSVVLQSPIPES